jgi:hypothetical protein
MPLWQQHLTAVRHWLIHCYRRWVPWLVLRKVQFMRRESRGICKHDCCTTHLLHQENGRPMYDQYA